MTPEFKIGDRVIITLHNIHNFGETGVIEEIKSYVSIVGYSVRLDNPGTMYTDMDNLNRRWYFKHQIEIDTAYCRDLKLKELL